MTDSSYPPPQEQSILKKFSKNIANNINNIKHYALNKLRHYFRSAASLPAMFLRKIVSLLKFTIKLPKIFYEKLCLKNKCIESIKLLLDSFYTGIKLLFILFLLTFCIWNGLKQIVVIAPFAIPSLTPALPFSQDAVANSIVDSLGEMKETISRGIYPIYKSKELKESRIIIGNFSIYSPLDDLEWRVYQPSYDFGQNMPNFTVLPKFRAEVQGFSLEALISFVRRILGNEQVIVGDVLSDGKRFKLTARSDSGGTFQETDSYVVDIDSFTKATRQIAEHIFHGIYPKHYVAYNISRGNVLEAFAEIQKLWKLDLINKKDSGLISYLGFALLFQRSFDEAITCSNMVLHLDPQNAEALYFKGVALTFKEDLDGALISFENSIKYDHTSEAILGLAAVYIKKNNVDQAAQLLEKSLKDHPKNPDIYWYLGSIFAQKGAGEKAIQSYLQALKEDPKNIFVRIDLGSAYLGMGLKDKALEEYLRVLQSDPINIKALNNAGSVYIDKNDYAKAIDLYERVLSIDPTNQIALNNLAIAYSKNNQYDKAIPLWQKAVAASPQDKRFLHNLSRALMDKKDFKHGLDILKKIIEIDPNDSDALGLIGNIHIGANEVQEAVNHYEKALSIKPNQLQTLQNLVSIYINRGETNRAIAISTRASLADPQSPDILFVLAFTYLQNRQLDEAQKIYEKIIDIQPGHVSSLNNLGYIYLQQGQKEKAVDIWRKALKYSPDDQSVQKNLKMVGENGPKKS